MDDRGRRPAAWTAAERRVLDRLRTPERVQQFLDSIPYNDESTCRSPRRVLRDRKAHCMEGALLAAAAMEHHGRPPAILDLRAAPGRDDDHVLTVFRSGPHFGAVAKSNFTGLRYRCPVYRSLRELAMSYFEDYFNLEGERTLREYSRLLVLKEDDFPGWQTAVRDLDEIGERLDAIRHFPVLTPSMAARLGKVDRRRYDAGLMGANAKGLFHV